MRLPCLWKPKYDSEEPFLIFEVVTKLAKQFWVQSKIASTLICQYLHCYSSRVGRSCARAVLQTAPARSTQVASASRMPLPPLSLASHSSSSRNLSISCLLSSYKGAPPERPGQSQFQVGVSSVGSCLSLFGCRPPVNYKRFPLKINDWIW